MSGVRYCVIWCACHKLGSSNCWLGYIYSVESTPKWLNNTEHFQQLTKKKNQQHYQHRCWSDQRWIRRLSSVQFIILMQIVSYANHSIEYLLKDAWRVSVINKYYHQSSSMSASTIESARGDAWMRRHFCCGKFINVFFRVSNKIVAGRDAI